MNVLLFPAVTSSNTDTPGLDRHLLPLGFNKEPHVWVIVTIQVKTTGGWMDTKGVILLHHWDRTALTPLLASQTPLPRAPPPPLHPSTAISSIFSSLWHFSVAPPPFICQLFHWLGDIRQPAKSLYASIRGETPVAHAHKHTHRLNSARPSVFVPLNKKRVGGSTAVSEWLLVALCSPNL